MSDPITPARQRIVDTAFALFYARGIRATGVDRIIDESCVAKATFYRHFPTKDDLVVAYLDHVDEIWRGQLADAAAAAGDDPREQLLGLFDALEFARSRPGYRGCAFINAGAEVLSGSPVHERAVRHKRDVTAWLEGIARSARASEPPALASSLAMVLDGGLSAGALASPPGVARTARAAAAAIIAEAGVHVSVHSTAALTAR